jgi:hypothetical protein
VSILFSRAADPSPKDGRQLFIGTHVSARPLRDQTHRELVYRPFQLHKRSKLFIGANDETLSVAMRASNPRCSACTPIANCGVDLISDALPFGRLWFSDNLTQSRTAAWDRTTCGSLWPLLNPVVADKAQATFVFAAEVQIPESPGAPMPSAASATRDVLQWLQIPNFDV